MKNLFTVVLTLIMVCSLAACSQPSSEPIDTQVPATQQPTQEPVSVTPSLQSTEPPAPTEPPIPYVPMDIFGSEFNPYADVDFPEYFTVFAATFNKSESNFEGKGSLTLYMTAANTDAAIDFIAELASLSEDDKQTQINDFNGGGFIEFTDRYGTVFCIRKTDRNDGRYEYIDGCLIEITSLCDGDVENYVKLVRDNFDMNALAPIADYLDVETDFGECSIDVNLHTNLSRTSVFYYVPDIDTVRQNIAVNIQSDWWEFSGNIETFIPYGLVECKLIFNSDAGVISVVQTKTI